MACDKVDSCRLLESALALHVSASLVCFPGHVLTDCGNREQEHLIWVKILNAPSPCPLENARHFNHIYIYAFIIHVTLYQLKYFFCDAQQLITKHLGILDIYNPLESAHSNPANPYRWFHTRRCRKLSCRWLLFRDFNWGCTHLWFFHSYP